MKKPNRIFTLLAATISLFVTAVSVSAQTRSENQHILWYESPADMWDHALPVGNGRLGAMVFGDPKTERIQLNEDSLWPGGPEWGNSKGNPEDLAEIRELVKTGRVHLADSLLVERFSYKAVARSHQTMGDLFIKYNHEDITDYTRQLDLKKALFTSSFKADGYVVSQEVFASAPDDVLVVRIKTANPEGMDFKLSLSRPEDYGHPTVIVSAPEEDVLKMKGMITQYGGAKNSEPVAIDHGVKFETILKANAETGSIHAEKDSLIFKDVEEVVLHIISSTSFYYNDFAENNKKTLANLEGKNYHQLLDRHIEDYQDLYDRTSLDLGQHHLDSLTTAQRVQRVKDGKEDLDLIAKLFQYGRYLLISSSRPGTNPANLQGIWNEHIQAPWNADYHLNINLQMNYWPAGPTNLSELQKPLFDFTDRLIERGKILAREQYGMRGAVAHQTTDLWATPWMRAERANWGSWIHGGGWLSRHYWEHFQFTQDTIFLKKRAYPALRAYARFYADWLTDDSRDGTLISTPETSPENLYIAPDGQPAAVSRGSAMGHQIIAEVFDNTLAAAEILGISNDFTTEIKKKRSRLHSGLKIGSDGRLMEWDREYEEAEKGHRHISHLYALHPGDDITSQQPKLFHAAEETIGYRLAHGGAGPGWSRAWIINFYARLLNAEAAYKHINLFMQRSIYPNLLDIHPPFQIDGNFGFTAGVAEMLLQSHEGFLRILPALPKAWATGSVRGLKARGNIEVDIEWKKGKLQELILHASEDQVAKIIYENKEVKIQLQKNRPLILNGQLRIIKQK